MRKKVIFFSLLTLSIFLGLFFYKTQIQRNDPYIEIPLHALTYNNFYYVNIEIENQTIPLLLDTGISGPFSLLTSSLKKIKNKKKNENYLYSMDINGNKYRNDNYIINSIKLGEFINMSGTVEEEDLEFLIDGSVIKNPALISDLSEKKPTRSKIERLEKEMGRMGNKVFKGYDYWCIDFPKSKMYYIGKWEDTLKRLNISLNEFIEIPLIESKSHIIISVDTDFGIKKFAIDTAAEKTVMKSPSEKFSEHQIITSKKFSANNRNMNQKEIYLFNFPSSNFDGFLGIDFFKNRTILLDFKNNKIFIGPEK